jgi:catechol 2,3-dioxygenase-like lactoylglutathione lyase family enzyme
MNSDLDAARTFYQNLPGVQVVGDNDIPVMIRCQARWLTVGLPSQPSTEVVSQGPKTHWLRSRQACR